MIQAIVAGLIGAVTGFASTFAITVAGLRAVGASEEQAASGLLILCLAQAAISMLYSWRYRMPLSFAWSTPGAAVLIAGEAVTNDFSAAVGAFIVSGILIVLTGLWPALARIMTAIPKPIAGAMLAGILFPMCLAPITASVSQPALALPVVLTWLVLQRLAPRWAVAAAMVVTAVVVGISAGSEWLTGAPLAPAVSLVSPSFDPIVIVSLGVPLYIVTMAGQNVPGFAVLTTFGYRDIPVRPVLVGSGLLSAVGAFAGGHQLNLAALSAAIMAGPDAHPDPQKRWVAGFSGGATYILLGLSAGAATALVAAAPPLLITAVAGLALLGAFSAGVVSAFEEPQHRLAAAVTLLVVASGVVIGGVGSAFWGLVVGLVVYVWLVPRRPRPDRDGDA
jgi:benzoate membrane transport protein